MASTTHNDTTVVVAGAGPAGLTAAYELATRTQMHTTVFEATDTIGGISQTVNHNGNRLDIGGHRFFSKNRKVTQLWEELMPPQTAPALDELLLGAQADTDTDATGHDPQKTDRVMLRRRRVSRIFYGGRFFDYPVTLSASTLQALGAWRTIKAGAGYMAAQLCHRPERSLEDFYINRFGKPLYRMFFEGYTEKVWGLHPSRLGADWGAQRVKKLSMAGVIKDMLAKKLGRKKGNDKVETSLIEEFAYPKYGPGQLWETMAAEACSHGAEIVMQTAVKRVHIGDGRKVESVTVVDADGHERRVECDMFVSSMPLSELVAALEGDVVVPEDVRRIAAGLPYRDFMTVGLLVDKLKIRNRTEIKTYAGRIPDTWMYVQDCGVKLGRIQIYNNWSPYMVADFKGKVWLGLEYFCNEGDSLWQMSDAEFIAMAAAELESIGIIDTADVEDSVRIKMKKAYPAYFGTYGELDTVRRFLDTIPNLYCIGRNGQHRYNNMDHSMLTAMEAADSIISGNSDKHAIWQVNTENEYHETR